MGFSAQDVQGLGKSAQKQILEKLSASKEKPVQGKKTGNKYNAKPTERTMPNGRVYVFASKKEAARYDELKLLLEAGKIRNLKIQPQFTLIEGYISEKGETVRAERYRADFEYEKFIPVRGWEEDGEMVFSKLDGMNWKRVVEDVKGKRTQTYINKRKQMREKGIEVREV